MKNQRLELFDQAAEMGVKIVHAKSTKDGNRIAIHLLNPELFDLEDALYTAERDMFDTIVIHNNQTWPKASK